MELFGDNFKTCLSQISLSPQWNYSKTILKLNFAKNSALQSQPHALHFSPNDSIGSRSTGGHLEISSVNNQRTARVFIRFLAYFLEANLSSTSLPSIFWKYSKTFHQQPEIIQRLFTKNPKIFKDFFACKIVLAANHQLYSGNIQRLFGQSTAAINSSNQQQ